MVITNLVAKPLNRVLLYCDDEAISQISLNSIAKYDLYINKELTQEDLEEILHYDLSQSFLEKSIRYCHISPKTEKQFRMHLDKIVKDNDINIDTNILDSIIEDVIEKLKQYDYINDEKYAEEFISSRIKNKPKGKQVLLYELISKGIDKDIASQAIDRTSLDEYSLMKESFYKKYKTNTLNYDDSKKISFLQRNGFSWDLIEQFIKESRDNQ